MDWVIGPQETTLWLWTDSPDPVTVRMPRDEWERLREAADGDIAAYVTRVLSADLGEHEGVLAD